MSDVACPACGETARLSGRPAEDGGAAVAGPGIEVRCEACAHVWRRDRRRCASCGGTASVEMTRQITRFPRGTLLAITGSQQVRVCPVCDAAVVEGAYDRGRPVPEGYVSRFLWRDDLDRGAPALQAAPTAPRTKEGGPTPRRPAGPDPVSKPPPAVQDAPGPADPTVRQATEAFLHEARGADPVALVMLGQHLGAATRLSALSGPSASPELEAWVRRTWGSTAPGSPAVTTIVAAVDHWRAAGWLTQDLAAGLR